MRELSGAEPRLWGSAIVGFGTQPLRYASGRELEWPLIAFSPRKQDLTLYLSGGPPLRAALLAKLGKHKTGKVCLYIKRLADVDLGVLRALIADALPGRHASAARRPESATRKTKVAARRAPAQRPTPRRSSPRPRSTRKS